MMRIVVVNHMHPSVRHVSGMRAWHFARELASRGHQVVLICEWRDGVAEPPAPSALPSLFGGHDWQQPFVLAVKPGPSRVLDRVRAMGTPAMLRKALVVWQYVRYSGMFTDFNRGVRPYEPSLASGFAPDVAWGSFGNTDCWLIAQRIARLSGACWVGDMKDAWDWWIPFGLRSLMARRFRSMAAATANSQFHGEALARWFPRQPTVVYSGVDADWIQPSVAAPDGFRVMLVGGTYDSDTLGRFMRAFAAWVRTIPEEARARIRFCYAGSDASAVSSAVGDVSGLVHAEVRGYVPLSELATLCRGAAVNVYLWSPATFHHKVVELLCARRPIVSFPGERAESIALAREAGGSLNVCVDERTLHRALDEIWRGGRQPAGGPDQLRPLTWGAQADRLEAVLRQVTERPR